LGISALSKPLDTFYQLGLPHAIPRFGLWLHTDRGLQRNLVLVKNA